MVWVSSSYPAELVADEFKLCSRRIVASWHFGPERTNPMNRIWSIEEQEFNDPASGFGFAFTSNPTASEDKELVLKITNAARDRTLTLVFDRGGLRIASTVDNPVGGEPLGAAAPEAYDGPPVMPDPTVDVTQQAVESHAARAARAARAAIATELAAKEAEDQAVRETQGLPLASAVHF
jgi:hypothetical protein